MCDIRTYLGTKLLDLRSQLLTLLSVLPFGCLLTLDDLQQVKMFLFQLLLLQQKFVEAGNTTTRNIRNRTLNGKYS
jgi:hypothetical protein